MQGSRREPLALRHSAIVFWVIALGWLAADQIIKYLVRTSLTVGESIAVVRGVFEITFVRNTGAAFGLLAGRQGVFILTSVLVLSAIALYWRRSRPTAWPVVVALGLITGGSVGNLIDRVTTGKVTDFLYFSLIDFPVFNIADIGIVVGVGILMAWLLLVPEPSREDAELGHGDADPMVSSEEGEAR